MITEIGLVAGEIWGCLEKTNNLSVDELAEQIGKSKTVVLMSAGWLAREGHITLAEKGDTYTVTLRKL